MADNKKKKGNLLPIQKNGKTKGNLFPIQRNGSINASQSTAEDQNNSWILPFYENQYLVEGAELACFHGEGRSVLKVPEGHNYYSGDKKKANCKDCIEGENIPYFESCSLNEETHQCQGFMDLADTWVNPNISRLHAELIDEEPAINMSSRLLCKKGGVIFPVTSGQGYDGALNEQAFEFRYQNIMRWADGIQGTSIFLGDPVNMNTGNYIYEKEDLRIGGISPLSFQLFYNAMDCGDQEVLGEGWSHNYGVCLKKQDRGELLAVILGDGREVSYRRALNGQYLPVMGDQGIIKESDEQYLCELDGQKYVFDKDGRMLCQTDAEGCSRKFSYNAEGLMEYAKNENGDFLHYTYNEENHLIFVEDHTGRKVSLEYQYGKLRWFTNSSKKTCTYEYNVNGRLQGIITPRGILAGKNEYDGENRVLKQIMPDGGVMEVRYDDENRRTYVREPNGSITSYECDERARNIRTDYGDGEELFAYNDRNQKVLFVDRNGNQTRYQYDEQGNLTGIVDALGEKASYTYDREGKLLTIAAFGKVRKKYEYDEKGRLIRITDVMGRSRRITYDENNRIRQIVLADGSSYQIRYDLKGNVVSVEDPYGARTCYQYDALNRVTARIDAEGNKTQYEYDERDHLTSITNPEGKTRSYCFNESGRPVQVRDFDGETIRAEYDCMNRPERLMDKEGNVLVLKYNQMGKVSEAISPTGTVTRYQYDRHNRLKRKEMIKKAKRSSEICVTEYTYDAVGNLLRIETGNGSEIVSVRSYTYDALNRVTEITDPAGRKTLLSYHYLGQISSIMDSDGKQRCFVYNEAGELTEETDPRGNVTRYTYNALGLTESVTDKMGRTTRYIYLPGGRLKEIQYPNGCFQCFTYDLSGRIKIRTDIYGNCLTYHYDCMGRILRMTGEAGQEKSFVYNSQGKPALMKDVTGNMTTYEYSPNGNVTAMTDAAGNRTEYTYDEEDRLIQVCQYGTEEEEPRKVIYERDSLGQVECIRDASGREEYYSYDVIGRVSEKIDRRGMRTVYFYTSDGKLRRIEYGDRTWAEIDYTTSGKPVLIKDPGGEIRIERDPSGKPVKVTNASGRSILYEWGDYGERKSIMYPDGEKVRYLYDEDLRLKELIRKVPGKKDVHIVYKRNKEGKLTEKLLGDCLRTVWKYNQLGQLSCLMHENGGKMLDEYHYEYDAAGNRISLTKKRNGFSDESGKYDFEYDNLYRLIRVKKDRNVLRSYQYDSFGNRIVLEDEQKGMKIRYTYNALNQMRSAELQMKKQIGDFAGIPPVIRSFDYDENGNLTEEYENGRLCRGYRYNAMNRLAEAWNGTGERSVYHYNGLGKRDGQDDMEYTLDLTRSCHDLLEIRTSGKTQKFYQDYALSFMEEDGRPERYYMNDELGSPVRVLYGTGKGDAYGYDEFGNDLSGLKRQSISSDYTPHGEGQPFGYTGYLCDSVSHTLYAQARQYQPGMGRFMAQDRIPGSVVDPKTLNRYVYCWNDPVDFVDPDGMKGYYFYDPDTFDKNMENMVDDDIEQLKEYYDTDIEKKEIKSAEQAKELWNGMDDKDGAEPVDVVVIFTHASNNALQMSSDNKKTEDIDETTHWRRKDIEGLDEKKINTLVLLGCNTGLDHPQDFPMKVSGGENIAYDYTMAEAFYVNNDSDSIGKIIASDGSVWHDYKDEHHTMQSLGNYRYHKTILDQGLNKVLEFFHISTYPETKGFAFYKLNNTGFKIYTDIGVYDIAGRKKYSNIIRLLVSCGISAVHIEKE